MNSRFISWDKLFSYWILIWFFVYLFASFNKKDPILGYIYENMNPVFLFIIALLSSLKNTLLLIIYNPKIDLILINICKFFFMKCIPLYYLLQQKINVKENIIFSLVSLNLYFIYLCYLNENCFDIYRELENQVIHNNCNTSLESLAKFIKSYFNISKN